jgi:hypothetical protein
MQELETFLQMPSNSFALVPDPEKKKTRFKSHLRTVLPHEIQVTIY